MIAKDSAMCAVLEQYLCSYVRMRVASYLSTVHFAVFAQFFIVCLIVDSTLVGTYFHCFHVTFASFDMHWNLFKF